LLPYLVYIETLQFYPERTTDFDCRISELEISATTIELLDRMTLHPQVFARTERVSLGGIIGKVEHDIFKDLSLLKSLTLQIYNIRGFMHTNGIGWMRFLNSNYTGTFKPAFLENGTLSARSKHEMEAHRVFVAIVNSVETTQLDSKYFPLLFYNFSDEDFCLFAEYPHERMVITQAVTYSPSCSCSLLWIYKYVPLFIQNGKGEDIFSNDICPIHGTVAGGERPPEVARENRSC
jgi:hypothetical protein